MDERSALDHHRVHLIARQRWRVIVPVLIADLFQAYLAYSIGYGAVAVVWYLACIAVHAARTTHVTSALKIAGQEPGRALRRLTISIGVVGLLKAAILPVFFLHGVTPETYLACVIAAGVAAGGVSSVGGTVTGYAAWAAPQALALSVGWAIQGGLGPLIGALWIMLYVILLTLVRDHRTAMLDLVREVAQREQLAQSLEAERDRANAAAAAKTRFFAAASHDLRQPLHALAINATTLEIVAGQLGDPRVVAVSNGIGSALEQSRSLLDSLLDISKLDAGAISVREFPCDLAALLRQLASPYQVEAQRIGLRFDVDVQPPPEGGWWVLVDPELMSRLVSNLLSNAMKFTNAGFVALRLAWEPVAQRVSISVSDSGPGIPPEQHQQVFEEFFQAGNPGRDRSKGLGLGLSIVSRIAGLMGASVELQSAVSIGSTFTVSFPFKSSQPEAVEVASAAPAKLHRGTVLVVDDESQIRDALATMLATSGWKVLAASDEPEAMLAVSGADARPDAVLMDYRLGDQNGVVIAARLFERFGQMPTLILTGETSTSVLLRIREAGLSILHKPALGRDVLVALDEMLASQQPAR
ncbi:hybrid sensor histidine kinase/response regulator [Piscinibacter sp. HJYY11]|uniref:hybrid sensor histidine kinase/response regulator n=1 Tax=Piscinibacter sp. HJYY11 TaxID=2801333 RepID=UPI00191DB36E|nr:hybrid sensor histidine kinase/response regulator [Piscinibacter sp. HJYY11]MBL0726903.1 response regulator [Piscinibacter sp. HJYY11]